MKRPHSLFLEYLSIIELLIDNGANINAVNSDNYSALMLAMDPGIYGNPEIFGVEGNSNMSHLYPFLDTTKVADLLIQRDADVNIVGKDGFTALILIAKTGKLHFHADYVTPSSIFLATFISNLNRFNTFFLLQCLYIC